MEDTRRRNDASMARKRANAKAINPAAANSVAGPESPLSPSSTGAMDSLLEKLRAAAPQARDQRDRRRRARLKDRHQVRVASGQTIPDMGDLTKNSSGDDEDIEKKLLDPSSAADGADNLEPISEGEDIADRAATLLEGLRKDGGENSENPLAGNRSSASRDSSGSLRVRRRRESADVERASRRRRRARESSSTATATDDGDDSATVTSPPGTSDGTQKPTADATIPEEPDDEDADEEEEEGEEDRTIMAADDGDEDSAGSLKSPPLPQTVVSPPSPEPGDRKEKPLVLEEDGD